MTRRKRPRPPRSRYLTFRTDDATIARVDALAPRYTHPWRVPSRSDLVRIALLAGLEALEHDPGTTDPAGVGGSPAL